MSKSYFQVAKIKKHHFGVPIFVWKVKKNSTHHIKFSFKKTACHTEMENENEIITHIFEKEKKVDPWKYNTEY